MLSFFKKIFGGGPEADFRALAQNGAQIIDVRSPGEYQTGHLTGSVNIPLQHLKASISKLNKDKPVIVCCASGMRSASAKTILKVNGFTAVYNGGGWVSLQNKIK